MLGIMMDLAVERHLPGSGLSPFETSTIVG